MVHTSLIAALFSDVSLTASVSRYMNLQYHFIACSFNHRCYKKTSTFVFQPVTSRVQYQDANQNNFHNSPGCAKKTASQLATTHCILQTWFTVFIRHVLLAVPSEFLLSKTCTQIGKKI